MKSVLGKYKCTVASHMAFSLLAVFLAQKCNHTKNSEGLENLGFQEWNANNSQFHSTKMKQLLVDVWNLHPSFLDDVETLNSIMHRVLRERGISIVTHSAQKFPGQGLTITYLLSESHAAVHTWPESGFAAFDFLTCGNADIEDLNDHLKVELEQYHEQLQQNDEGKRVSIRYDWSLLTRGEPPQQRIMHDGQALRSDMYLRKEQVHEENSPIQQIEIWDIEAGPSMIWGEGDMNERWLLLDGIHQISTLDEQKYHEALVAPVMLSHLNPKNVAILGGGDGGALREALNFHSVESVYLVEIDERVVKVSQEYLPSLAASMAHPKAHIHIADAFQWIKNNSGSPSFDVVIVDLLDITGSMKKSVFGHWFEANSYTGIYEQLEEFFKDIQTAVGKDGALAFQLGEELMPTACSMTNPKLQQQEECGGFRRQYIFLDTLKKYFAFTHVYSVYISSWRGLWSIVMATNSELVEDRFSRRDLDQIASDLQVRTMHPCSNLGPDTLVSFQIQPNIWTNIDKVMFTETEEQKLEDMTLPKADEQLLCPHIKQLVPNNNKHIGYVIPYRLSHSSVAPSGVGVFTLQDIKRGDVVWRFHKENFLLVTKDNWLSLVEEQVRQRNWKGAPDIDVLWEEALGAGWKPDNQTAPVPSDLIRVMLMRDWINDWPKELVPKIWHNQEDEHEEEDEEETMVMLYELDDAKFINHGPYGMKEDNFMRSIEYQNLEETTTEEALISKISIAVKDIPACTELLENYWHADENLSLKGDELDMPAWFDKVLESYEGVKEFLNNPPYKFSSSFEANVGSF